MLLVNEIVLQSVCMDGIYQLAISKLFINETLIPFLHENFLLITHRFPFET
jgi:hypothetical protein